MQGRQALDKDVNFALKEAAMFRITQDRDFVAGLPRGPELLDAVDAGSVTLKDIDDLLLRHFEFLREQVLIAAKNHSLVIDTIVSTGPNHLSECEKGNYFDLYMDYVTGIVRLAWGPGMRYEECNEGQGIASYICQVFVDPFGPVARRQWLHELFPNVDITAGVVLVILDGGSSGSVRDCLYYPPL